MLFPKSLRITKKVAKQILHGKIVGVRFLSTENSDFFKFYCDRQISVGYTPLNEDDYRRFISKRSSLRETAITRQITSLAYKVGKDFVSLAEGMPNEEVFPFSRVAVELKTGESFLLEGKELVDAMQYLPTQGKPELVKELRALNNDLHRPPRPSTRDIIVTSGGQYGIYSAVDLLLNPGECVILQEHTYTGIHVVLKPYRPEILTIPEDDNGLIPEHLEAILETRAAQRLPPPKFLYVVPTGSNPSGTVISEERRRRIYDLACRYDFLILEDDPYMFMNYTEVQVPSFLSMDEASRVIRLDSLSKVLAPGLRSGWVSAPRPLLQRLELHLQADHLHAASLPQAILCSVLKMWGRSGLASQLLKARELYRSRRDALQVALATHAADVATWRPPDAGMFFWLRLNVDDVFDMVFKSAFEKGLMLIPGQACTFDTSLPSPYLRLAFSKVNVADMDCAARLLAEIIRDEMAKANVKVEKSAATQQ